MSKLAHVNLANEPRVSPKHDLDMLNSLVPLSAVTRLSRKLYFIYRYAEEPEKKLFYEPLRNYSFYDDDEYGKVLVTLPGVEALKKQDIKATFAKRSLEIKIDDFSKKAYVFAVPVTDIKLDAEGCSFFLKKDKIVLKLKKQDPKVSFTSLLGSSEVLEVGGGG